MIEIHSETLWNIAFFFGFGMSTKGPSLQDLVLSLRCYREVVEPLRWSEWKLDNLKTCLEGNLGVFASCFPVTFFLSHAPAICILCYHRPKSRGQQPYIG